MLLLHSGSKRAVGKNISELYDSGFPQRQAIAIALDNQCKYSHKADGGGESGGSSSSTDETETGGGSRGMADNASPSSMSSISDSQPSASRAVDAGSAFSDAPDVSTLLAKPPVSYRVPPTKANPYGGPVDKHGNPLQTQPSKYQFRTTPDNGMTWSASQMLDKEHFLKSMPSQTEGDWQQIQDNPPQINEWPGGEVPMMAVGGAPPPGPAQPKSSGHVVGLIKSPVAGRTDRLPMRVLQDSYVIPADVVSNGYGQGNTDAGGKILDAVFNAHHQRGASNAPHLGKSETIPIIAAGGEYVVHPWAVASIGGGDVKKGHKVLDEMVVSRRKAASKQTMKLPPPKVD